MRFRELVPLYLWLSPTIISALNHNNIPPQQNPPDAQRSAPRHRQPIEPSPPSSSLWIEPSTNRRKALQSLLVISSACWGVSSPTQALVTDETDRFADNWWTNNNDGDGTSPSSSGTDRSVSDEVMIDVPIDDVKRKGGLGLELSEVEFRTNRRVFVKSVQPGSVAEAFGIQKDWIVVSVNGQSAERTDASGVAILVSKAVQDNASKSLMLRFRDPAIFQGKLRTFSAEGNNGSAVTTQIAPSGDTTQRKADGSVMRGESVRSQDDQRLTVSQLIPPKVCRRGAQVDDLLEISYVGQVVETGQIFDGSAVKINGQGIPGRANDVSIFFVLGKQPFGQFPPGWDVGLEGMCVGERRRLLVPPVMAYGSKGLPRRGIPPDATLQYDVSLVSLNGLATPQ